MSIKRVLVISRPILWSWTALAYLTGLGNLRNFGWVSLGEFLFFLLPLNFFLYGLNDIYDRKSDFINPRKGGLLGAVVGEHEVWPIQKLALIFALLFLVVAAFSRNLEHFIFSLLFLAAGFAYSHKSFRLKEIPFLDATFASIIYLLPATIAFSLQSSIAILPFKVFVLGIPLIGAHAISTLVDAKYDKAVGIQTSGVFLGNKNTVLFALITFLIPLVFFYQHQFLVTILAINVLWLLIFYFSSLALKDDFLLVLSSIHVTSYMMALFYFFLGANGYTVTALW